jgi:hypothetical protein
MMRLYNTQNITHEDFIIQMQVPFENTVESTSTNTLYLESTESTSTLYLRPSSVSERISWSVKPIKCLIKC